MATPAPRWYFDADTIGLGKLLSNVRHDVTWPGDSGQRTGTRYVLPPCIITQTDTPDHKWIPMVTAAGMAIITRDRHIQTRTIEIDAVLAARSRMFAITSSGQLNNWGLLEVFMTRWRDIESAARDPGPFIYSVTRTAVHRLNI